MLIAIAAVLLILLPLTAFLCLLGAAVDSMIDDQGDE